MVFEKLKILGFDIIPNWGFCSNLTKLMKLACSIDVIGHYLLNSFLYDDQLVNIFQIDQVVFQIFGFLLETLCSSQFCEFELNLDLIFCISSCIISFKLFMHHIDFLCYIFFVLTCSLPLVLFLVFLFFCSVFWSLS